MITMSLKPAVVLLTSSNCPHCTSLKKQLDDVNNQGRLSSFEVINVEEQPEVAKHYNVRSVPWFKLGSYEFDEGMTAGQLNDWLDSLEINDGNGRYLEYLLLNGKLNQAINWLENSNSLLEDVLELIVKPDVKINVRIGVGAVMEHFEGSALIRQIQPQIVEMLHNENPAIRADACHFLSLTNDQSVLGHLQVMLNDNDEHVREIAQEGLDDLNH